MADLRHNGIRFVRGALAKANRMNVDVGNDFTTCIAAVRPESSEPASIDFNDAGIQRMRVDVIIEDELFDPALFVSPTQKEGATFAPAVGPAVEFRDTGSPNYAVTQDFRRWPEEAARERCY
ncbi:hypothetical protein [Rhizobium chutanense]|uniref:hypothetical protein n=1 Tax=Rhizobium chutanense TaxID=2035448 RepID=UPI00117B925F|nr:hypothetical protein [Rhizobium chutanense]